MWNTRPLTSLLTSSFSKVCLSFQIWPKYSVRHHTTGIVKSRVIRRAQVEDYHDLMAFGEQHLGTDYFGHYFYKWVYDRTFQPFVLKESGKMVAFLLCQVIDGGQGVVFSASRVAVHLRRKGYLKMMTSHVENYLQEQMPQVKYIKIVLDDEHLHKIGPFFLRQGHVIMSRKTVYTVLFDFSEMSNAHQSDQVCPPLKSGYLKRIFGCNNLMQQFCPDNHLFIKYTPYNAVISNIPHINGTYHRVFASTPVQSGHISDSLDAISSSDFITFAQFYVGEIGLCYCVDISATRDASFTSLQNIVTRNLQEISYLTGSSGIISFSFNQNISLDQVMSCLDRHGVRKFLPGLECVQFYILQRQLLKDK